MGEVREWWINVYTLKSGSQLIGRAYPDPGWAKATALNAGAAGHLFASLRIHVRLKPEGAPKRYADESNRRAWERHGNWCRSQVVRGHDPRRLLVGRDL